MVTVLQSTVKGVLPPESLSLLQELMKNMQTAMQPVRISAFFILEFVVWSGVSAIKTYRFQLKLRIIYFFYEIISATCR